MQSSRSCECGAERVCSKTIWHCSAAGHLSDDRDFPHYDAAHWANLGHNTPRNCQTCKTFTTEVEKCGPPPTPPCQHCRKSLSISARYVIWYHKRVGMWVAPSICDRCTQTKLNPRRKTSAFRDDLLQRSHDPAIEKRLARAELEWAKGEHTQHPQVYAIPSDPAYYESCDDREHGKVVGHIMKDEHGWEIPFPEVLRIADALAQKTSGEVMQKKSGSNIVKFDIPTRTVLILGQKPTDPPPPRMRVITCFVARSDKYIDKKLIDKEWE